MTMDFTSAVRTPMCTRFIMKNVGEANVIILVLRRWQPILELIIMVVYAILTNVAWRLWTFALMSMD